ncbi:MAG: hypothetical protein A2X93_00035 [Deltaproteobacteria bacterium GWC2_56_8]|nr:MAG: hypothetical protein A2X93_00035 [Deltaproteobacteria bacterium GWC2_56_8]
MNIAMKLLALFFGVLMLGNVANAESPREQLKQMVEQLQKTPSDDALREQVIHLARETKPKPTIPHEALQLENAGLTLFKKAKTQQDFQAVVHEYEQALRLAPWVASLYFGLGEAYEKLGDTTVGELGMGAQDRQSCSSETQKNEWRRFDGYKRAGKNFKYYLLAVETADAEVAAMIERRIAERDLRFARWRYQWETACCMGCGGKAE